MNNSPCLSSRGGWQRDTFPDVFSEGATVLVACAGDPVRYDVDLHALCEYGTGDDTALIVTTTTSASTTLETYERLCTDTARPSLGLVDTTATQPSADAIYNETPVVYIPSPGDVERLILALSELSENRPLANGSRHLLVRSLTPIIDSISTNRVGTVLDRITGLRTRSGLCLLGVDYTAHDDDTVTSLVSRVDGILWVTASSPDQLNFEYRPAKRWDP